jgi:hypothetical protein
MAFSADGKTLTSASMDGTIRRWEVSTGKNRLTIQKRWLCSAAFSPDGKTIAGGSAEGTITLWSVTAGNNERTVRSVSGDDKRTPLRPGAPSKAESTVLLSDKELTALWDDLAGTDAAKAYQAIGRLVACPTSTVPFFTKQLRPATAPDPKQVAQLIADLDSDQFTARQEASAALEKLGETVRPLLRSKLADKPTPEVQRRIEELLQSLEQLSPESLRSVRAMETLEYIGNAEAKQLLATLAQGATGSRLTKEAQATLDRLDRKEGR